MFIISRFVHNLRKPARIPCAQHPMNYMLKYMLLSCAVAMNQAFVADIRIGRQGTTLGTVKSFNH